MQKAKAAGIDAFALNIGTDSYTDKQLGFAYESAAKNGMNVFISFDFNWWNPSSDAAKMGAKIKQYGTQAAQLKVDGGKVFVSSFAGDDLDVETVRSSAGIPLFIAPNFQPSNAGKVDGVLNWIAWDSNGANKAPSPQTNLTVSDGDHTYLSALQGKPYIARKSIPIHAMVDL